MPVLLVRHADAGSRADWTGPDELRPLADRGRVQARGLVHLLGDRQPIGRLASSPSVRCIETVAPLAAAFTLDIGVERDLVEGADPARALALVRVALAEAETVVLCSHGDVIPGVLELVSAAGVDLGHRPLCQKGSAWRLDGDGASVRHATYLPPP